MNVANTIAINLQSLMVNANPFLVQLRIQYCEKLYCSIDGY